MKRPTDLLGIREPEDLEGNELDFLRTLVGEINRELGAPPAPDISLLEKDIQARQRKLQVLFQGDPEAPGGQR